MLALATALCGVGALTAQEGPDANRRDPPPSQSTPPAGAGATKRSTGISVRAGRVPRPDPDAPGTHETPGTKPRTDGSVPDLPVDLAPRGRCRFEVSVVPSRILPGRTGTARIVMVLEDDSVLQSAADIAVVVAEDAAAAPSSLRVGPATVQPPTAASLAPAYVGRPAYDDWALIEVPVTVAEDAPVGSKQSLAVEVRFRLHEGATGRLFGAYESLLTIACEVGAAPAAATQLPEPRPPMSAADRPAEPRSPSGRAHESAAPTAVEAAQPALPAQPAAADAEPGDAPFALPEEEDELPLLVFAGGLALLGAGLLLLRRR